MVPLRRQHRTDPRGVRRLVVLVELARQLGVDPIEVVVNGGCEMQITPDAVVAVKFGETTITARVSRREAAALVSA